MRCSQCEKFVSNEQREVDGGDVDVEVSDDARASAEVEIVNECADCSTDLTTASLSLESEPAFDEEEIKAHREAHPDCTGFEAEDVTAERVERSEGKGRGRRTYYGVEVSCTVKCECAEDVADRLVKEGVTMEAEIQASAMDEA